MKNPQILQSSRGAAFNHGLLEQYQIAQNAEGVRKTHYFDGRYENVYLDDAQIPLLTQLKTDARSYAQDILHSPIDKMGCWFNAMEPGQRTTLHSHDEDDERLSGVYYVYVPENSGKLIIHTAEAPIEHTPKAGQWVFFTPQTPHEVEQNNSDDFRLSIAFNFS